jgi:PAS domain S-box-containing protein
MKDLLRIQRNLLVRYGVALALACLALLIRGLLPIRPGIAIYQLALAAVVVSAWYGGRGPGLLAVLISAAGILYWFIPPADSFALPAEYALSLTLFLANGVLLTEFSMGRHRAEQALEESEGRFRLMAETVPEVLWIESLDPPRVLYLSPSYYRIWGRPAKNLCRNHDWQLEAIHPEDRPYVSSTLKRWLAGEDEDRYDIEYRIIRQDGGMRWIHARGTLIRDEHGKAYRASGIAEDITEAKRSQEALDNAQAELAHVTRVATLGEMSASIAHEINQPLASVVNNASACLRWLAAQNLDAARQSATRIIADGHRAGEIISRIRALANKVPPQKAWLNINETILEVIALARSEVQSNRVSLQTQLSDDLPLILGDRIQLQQVILNLINNAIEAMSGDDNGPRELQVGSAKGESQGVQVAVRDSGPGLDLASLDRLFHAFYTTKPQGMGLGLAISRSIVEAHGGRLWATANENRGAVFQFTLPTGGVRAS